jgi:hypothetical protein
LPNLPVSTSVVMPVWLCCMTNGLAGWRWINADSSGPLSGSWQIR